jgi:lysophospholipase L1-like esterase
MTTQTIRNGASIVINLQPSESLKVVAASGNYTLTGGAGSVAGTTIAAAATGGTYGPYAAPVTVFLISSASSEIDFDSGTAPVVASDTYAVMSFDSVGNVSGLVDPVTGQTVVSANTINSIATRIFAGRMEFDFNNTAANTWEVLMALEQDFDAVRVIFAQGRNAGATTAAPLMLANVAVVADTTNAASDAATWTGVAQGGNSTWTLTAGSAQQRRAFVVSDWVAVASIPRTDGGTKPLLAVRGWVNGGNPLTLIGNSSGTDSFANWATKPDGRIWKMRKAAGNYASTSQASFGAAATTANESPIVGVQYLARGRVVTVMAFGDSIFEGRGTYLGESFAAQAAWSKSNASNVAYEYCNLAWSGAPSTVFVNAMTDAFAAGLIPDVAIFPVGSPNDVSTTITSALVSSIQSKLATMTALCRTNRVVPLLCSWMPTNTAVKNYGATDSLRVALSQSVEARAAKGLPVAATSTAISGLTSGGQVQMTVGLTGDGIHPNDAGNALLAVPVAQQLGRVIF